MASTRVVRAHSRHQASSDWNTGMAVLGNPGLEGGGSEMQGTAALECRARWEGEEYEVWFVWPSLPGLYRGNWGSRRAIFVPFRYSLRNLAQMVFL